MSSRRELERALRRANLEIALLRDRLDETTAQLLALTRELSRAGAIDSDRVDDDRQATVDRLHAYGESAMGPRVELAAGFVDKYQRPELDIPCAELLPICQARCCSLRVCLSSQDLDEGVVEWDYGHPYHNRQRADGSCSHLDEQKRCTVYAQRPAMCRDFDCRGDDRIWADFERRIPATGEQRERAMMAAPAPVGADELRRRAAARRAALDAEVIALRDDD